MSHRRCPRCCPKRQTGWIPGASRAQGRTIIPAPGSQPQPGAPTAAISKSCGGWTMRTSKWSHTRENHGLCREPSPNLGPAPAHGPFSLCGPSASTSTRALKLLRLSHQGLPSPRLQRLLRLSPFGSLCCMRHCPDTAHLRLQPGDSRLWQQFQNETQPSLFPPCLTTSSPASVSGTRTWRGPPQPRH